MYTTVTQIGMADSESHVFSLSLSLFLSLSSLSLSLSLSLSPSPSPSLCFIKLDDDENIETIQNKTSTQLRPSLPLHVEWASWGRIL